MRTKLATVCLILGSLILISSFQNCAKVGFSDSNSSFKLSNGQEPGSDLADGQIDRDAGNDLGSPLDRDAGDDRGVDEIGTDEDEDWLYIPGGRGHVPMSSVAICPEGLKDEGKQKCPMFCFEGVDYVMHKSDARNYFAKKFDEQADYGGGAVPGTCAEPDLKIK